METLRAATRYSLYVFLNSLPSPRASLGGVPYSHRTLAVLSPCQCRSFYLPSQALFNMISSISTIYSFDFRLDWTFGIPKAPSHPMGGFSASADGMSGRGSKRENGNGIFVRVPNASIYCCTFAVPNKRNIRRCKTIKQDRAPTVATTGAACPSYRSHPLPPAYPPQRLFSKS